MRLGERAEKDRTKLATAIPAIHMTPLFVPPDKRRTLPYVLALCPTLIPIYLRQASSGNAVNPLFGHEAHLTRASLRAWKITRKERAKLQTYFVYADVRLQRAMCIILPFLIRQ